MNFILRSIPLFTKKLRSKASPTNLLDNFRPPLPDVSKNLTTSKYPEKALVLGVMDPGGRRSLRVSLNCIDCHTQTRYFATDNLNITQKRNISFMKKLCGGRENNCPVPIICERKIDDNGQTKTVCKPFDFQNPPNKRHYKLIGSSKSELTAECGSSKLAMKVKQVNYKEDEFCTMPCEKKKRLPVFDFSQIGAQPVCKPPELQPVPYDPMAITGPTLPSRKQEDSCSKLESMALTVACESESKPQRKGRQKELTSDVCGTPTIVDGCNRGRWSEEFRFADLAIPCESDYNPQGEEREGNRLPSKELTAECPKLIYKKEDVYAVPTIVDNCNRRDGSREFAFVDLTIPCESDLNSQREELPSKELTAECPKLIYKENDVCAVPTIVDSCNRRDGSMEFAFVDLTISCESDLNPQREEREDNRLTAESPKLTYKEKDVCAVPTIVDSCTKEMKKRMPDFHLKQVKPMCKPDLHPQREEREDKKSIVSNELTADCGKMVYACAIPYGKDNTKADSWNYKDSTNLEIMLELSIACESESRPQRKKTLVSNECSKLTYKKEDVCAAPSIVDSCNREGGSGVFALADPTIACELDSNTQREERGGNRLPSKELTAECPKLIYKKEDVCAVPTIVDGCNRRGGSREFAFVDLTTACESGFNPQREEREVNRQKKALPSKVLTAERPKLAYKKKDVFAVPTIVDGCNRRGRSRDLTNACGESGFNPRIEKRQVDRQKNALPNKVLTADCPKLAFKKNDVRAVSTKEDNCNCGNRSRKFAFMDESSSNSQREAGKDNRRKVALSSKKECSKLAYKKNDVSTIPTKDMKKRMPVFDIKQVKPMRKPELQPTPKYSSGPPRKHKSDTKVNTSGRKDENSQFAVIRKRWSDPYAPAIPPKSKHELRIEPMCKPDFGQLISKPIAFAGFVMPSKQKYEGRMTVVSQQSRARNRKFAPKPQRETELETVITYQDILQREKESKRVVTYQDLLQREQFRRGVKLEDPLLPIVVETSLDPTFGYKPKTKRWGGK